MVRPRGRPPLSHHHVARGSMGARGRCDPPGEGRGSTVATVPPGSRTEAALARSSRPRSSGSGTSGASGGAGCRRPRSGMTREVDERVQERHSKVVQGFLWALLAVVVAVSLLNVLLLGEASLPGLAPNLLFAALIGSSLFLNRRGRFRLAVGLLTAIITLIASLAPLATGL